TRLPRPAPPSRLAVTGRVGADAVRSHRAVVVFRVRRPVRRPHELGLDPGRVRCNVEINTPEGLAHLDGQRSGTGFEVSPEWAGDAQVVLLQLGLHGHEA